MTLTWTTPAGFLGTVTELVYSNLTVNATTATSYRLISGTLPSGLSLISQTGNILGIPSAVSNVTKSTFVVRASDGTSVIDRTFNIDVAGPDTPGWSTPAGYLNVGIRGEPYAINNQYVNLQLQANLVESPTSAKLKYFIGDKGGRLPPGVTLSEDGLISGFLKDTLVFDGRQSETGGYDDEQYDNYSYDHFEDTGSTSIGIPKIYNFEVTASDGVLSTSRVFKILVVNPEMIRSPEAVPFKWPANTIVTNTNYIPPLQFIKGNDLGTIRANNNHDINVSAYDPYPNYGSVFYEISTATDALPSNLKIERRTGVIYGLVPYQPAYTRNYQITVNAYRLATTSTNLISSSTNFISNFQLAVSTNTFSLSVKGEVESTINWVTPHNLGDYETGKVSQLYVAAEHVNSEYSIKYRLISGTIPPGLTLERDGTLSGAINHDAYSTYQFTVEASDVYGLSAITRTFTLRATQPDSKSYTKIYARPFMSESRRGLYQEFITNEFTFDPTLMYRYFDPNFGVQNNIKMMLEFAIEKQPVSIYAGALRENFYRKKLYFGDIKVAIARDDAGNDLYEIVYVDIIDDQVNSEGKSASMILESKGRLFYPASVENMKRQLETLVLPDYSYIGVRKDFLPLFMQTIQPNSYRLPGYMKVVPLCYALPGNGAKIVSRIKLSGFDFKQLDFEIDRLIVENSLDTGSAKYLIFSRQSIGDTIPEDESLYGPDDVLIEFGLNDDSAIILEDGSILTTEDGIPIEGLGF